MLWIKTHARDSRTISKHAWLSSRVLAGDSCEERAISRPCGWALSVTTTYHLPAKHTRFSEHHFILEFKSLQKLNLNFTTSSIFTTDLVMSYVCIMYVKDSLKVILNGFNVRLIWKFQHASRTVVNTIIL